MTFKPSVKACLERNCPLLDLRVLMSPHRRPVRRYVCLSIYAPGGQISPGRLKQCPRPPNQPTKTISVPFKPSAKKCFDIDCPMLRPKIHIGKEGVIKGRLQCTSDYLPNGPRIPGNLSECPQPKGHEPYPVETPDLEQDDRPDHVASLGGY